MPTSTYLTLILTTFFWGGTFVAGRMLANSLPPASSSFLRFAIASICLIIMVLATEKRLPWPKRGQYLPLLFLGLTGIFGYNIFFFTGLKYITAGRAALFIAFTPLTITVLAALFSNERLNIRQTGGILISLAGALLVISNGNPAMIFNGAFGPGEKALMGCVLCWSIYSIAGRALMKTLPPLITVCYSSIAGTLLLAIPAFKGGLAASLATISTWDWLSLCYLGLLGTAIGFLLYYRAIKRIGPTRTAIFINLVPVFAILLSSLLLHETVGLAVLLGGACIIIGVTVTNMATP